MIQEFITNLLKQNGVDTDIVNQVKSDLSGVHNIEDAKNILQKYQDQIPQIANILKDLSNFDINNIKSKIKNKLPPVGDNIVDSISGFFGK